ncbi:MAG: hypothetical protein ACF8XB_18760 [Planctomycetota bacterium JB042]
MEAQEAAATMKGWLKSVLLPTVDAALKASVPISTLWLLYQASPKHTKASDAERAEAARIREESTAAITSTALVVVGLAGTAAYFLDRRTR